MASFSFGAGNAGKLLRIPLYLAGWALTAIIPRRRDLWVFGSPVGLADGAWALWVHAAERGHRGRWLTATDAEQARARAAGITCAPKGSWRGFWWTARAGVIVLTHGFGDVNRYAATGGVIVQLWHGIPLKRLGLDTAVTTRTARLASRPLSQLLRMLYRRTQGRITILPASSQAIRGRLESAFGLPDARVPVTGEPRVDVLSRGTASERRERALAAVTAAVGPLPAGARLVLYAPTWRDGAPDPAIPTTQQWEQIVAALQGSDAVLLVRAHPLGVGDYVPPASTDRVRLLGADLVADITPLLPGMDVFVTDYSSLAYDVTLIPLPSVFFAPDLADYGRERGFYGTYEQVSGPDPAGTWTEALAQLGAVLGDEQERERRLRRARELSAAVHDFTDGENTARVYARVIAATGGSR